MTRAWRLFAALALLAAASAQTVDNWTLISRVSMPVNAYAPINHNAVHNGRTVTSVYLRYVSGSITCSGTPTFSRFGCRCESPNDLMVMVLSGTSAAQKLCCGPADTQPASGVYLPTNPKVLNYTAGSINCGDFLALNTDDFTLTASPLYLAYGEHTTGYTTSDNSGTAVYDVYYRFSDPTAGSPTVTLSSTTAPGTVLLGTTDLAVTATFSEVVAGFNSADLVLSGLTLVGSVLPDSVSSSFTFTLRTTTMGGTTASVQVAASGSWDLAGNPGTGSSSLSWTSCSSVPCSNGFVDSTCTCIPYDCQAGSAGGISWPTTTVSTQATGTCCDGTTRTRNCNAGGSWSSPSASCPCCAGTSDGYSWPQTASEASASLVCNNNPHFSATRACTAGVWQAVSTAACVADVIAPSFSPGNAPALVVLSPTAARVTAALNEPASLYCAAALHTAPPAAYTSAQVKAAAQAASFPSSAFVAGVVSSAVQSSHTLDLSLQRATAYDVYCVAEDNATPKLRVLDNLQGSPTNSTIFTGGCLEGNATVRVPTLNLAGSSISGSNLVIRLDSSRHFQATRLAFVGSSDADCTMQAEVNTGSQPAENEWLYSADSLSCNDAWTYTYLLTSVLAECGFAEQGSTAEFTEYRATLEATTVENGSNPVFGVTLNRTERTAVVMGVRVPNLANVTNNASVFGAAIPITATTTQVFDTVNRNFSFVLATSVQHPYELFVDPAATTSGEGGHTVYGAVAENDCAAAGSGECLQRFAIGLRPAAAACTVNSTLTTTFRVRCRASFTGACDAPSLSQFTAAFQVLTDDFCARVVEIGAVTPSLEVYDSEAARNARLAQTSDAVTSSLLFYRVDLVLEAGLQATSLNLTDVRIRSFCTEPCDELVQPVTNGAVALNAFADYGFQITSQAGSRADFQFQLNDNSISFDNDDPSGSVNVQVTVGAVVNYTAPSGQKLSRRVELLAAAGGGSAAVSASAQFGASGGPAAPASVSGESTVLGMTQGTAIVAGVGLVAIAVIAVGAAVVARRRRVPPRAVSAAKLSSSQVQLMGPSGGSPSVAISTGDLATVQSAYGMSETVHLA